MNIVILGNGAEVPNIIEIINRNPELRLAGILDDAATEAVDLGCRIIGRTADAVKYEDHQFVWGMNSINNRFLRLKLMVEMGIPAKRFITLIHPAAIVSASALVGAGSVIQAGAVIGCNVKIGVCSYLSPNCVIGHDTVLGAGTIMASGAMLAGRITMGAANYIGMGACIKEELRLGHGNIVGMMAAVIRNVADGNTLVGVPASIIGNIALPERFDSWINTEKDHE